MAVEKDKKKELIKEEDYPLTHVPMSARKGLLPVAAVLVGFTFFTPTMVAGTQLGAAFKFSDLILILLAGNLILGVYVACMCAIGAKTGLTSVLLSRYSLGTGGAKWSDVLLGGTQVLWYAITAEYMGQMFAVGLGLPGWRIFFIIFWAIVIGFSALYGFKSMAILGYIAFPLMVVLVVVVTWMAFRELGSIEAIFGDRNITQTMTFTAAITTVVGTFASGGTQSTNWSRFGRTAKIGFFAGFIAFFIGNAIMVFTGMIGGFAYQTADLLEVMILMGLIVWALLILTLNIWTTNNAAAYAFGVAGAEMFGKEKKAPFVIGGVIIATVVAVLGVGAYFIPMLGFFGTFIPPLGGIIIGDFLFSWKRRIPRLENVKFKVIRIGPLLAYAVGCAAAHFGAMYNFGVPSLQGIIVAIFCVPLFNAIFKALGVNDTHEVQEDAEYV